MRNRVSHIFGLQPFGSQYIRPRSTIAVWTETNEALEAVGLCGLAGHEEAIRFLDGCFGGSGLYRSVISLGWEKRQLASAGMQ